MGSSSYDVRTTAKCLATQIAEENCHSFLVGTSNLRTVNEIKVLRYSEDDEQIRCVANYNHQSEILALQASPTHNNIISTISNSITNTKGSVWRMPDLPSGDASSDTSSSSSSSTAPLNAPEPSGIDLQWLADIPAWKGTTASTNSMLNPRLHALSWSPSSSGSGASSSSNTVAAIYNYGLQECLVREDGTITVNTTLSFQDHPLTTHNQSSNGLFDPSSTSASFIGGAAWDPHHPNEFAIAADAGVYFWDMKQGECIRSIEGNNIVPSGGCIRSLTYNPNKPWYLATGGDDSKVKCWDIRKTTVPVKILEGHTHWISQVAYNPFHDQLLLSGSTDGRVDLWRISSISSAPLLELGDEELENNDINGTAPNEGTTTTATVDGSGGTSKRRNEPKLAADSAIKVHDDHEDTITGIAWSVYNAWVYASLSYTGKFIVAQVPSAEKYKILL